MVKNLRHLRELFRVSQTQMADLLGISQQSIHKYETSSTEPDISALCRLAEFFNTSVDYIVGKAPYSEIREGGRVDRLTSEDVALVCQFHDLSARSQLCVQDLMKTLHHLEVAQRASRRRARRRAKERKEAELVSAGQIDTDSTSD